LRMQQILAYETDLLEYDDLFDENPAVTRKVEALKAGTRAELAQIDAMGGAVGAIDYMKSRLVDSNAARIARIESGETTVVGVNRWVEGADSPLTAGDGAIMVVDEAAEADQVARLADWRAGRDADAVAQALAGLRDAARSGQNIMVPSIAAAKAGVTTGEWGDMLREAFGQYRGPTGVSKNPSNRTEGLEELREQVNTVSDKLGHRMKFVMAKPGLDGHSNGAEQIAARARDCGMDITYDGIRMTPEEIVESARAQNADVIGVSILSGSHLPLVEELMGLMAQEDMQNTPVVVGGIIPDGDVEALIGSGVSRVYTPKDFQLNRIMGDLIELASGEVT